MGSAADSRPILATDTCSIQTIAQLSKDLLFLENFWKKIDSNRGGLLHLNTGVHINALCSIKHLQRLRPGSH